MLSLRLVAAMAALAGAADAGAGRIEPDRQPGAQPELALAGQMDLARLVDVAAQRLHLNVEYDPAALRIPVTIRLDSAVTDEELWVVVNRVLASRGFTTVRAPGKNAFSVVRAADASNLAPPDVGEQAGALVPGFRAVVLRAVHRTPKELSESLAKFLSKPGGSAAPLGETGLMLVSDYAWRVDQALQILKMLDVPGEEPELAEIPVKNLSAAALSTLLADVTAKRNALTASKAQGEVIASPAKNAMLVVAPASRLSYWRDLIAELDQRERTETVSYEPRTFSLSEVSRLIEDTVRDVPGLPPDERWRSVVDELTGSLIVTATPTQHEKIKALVERLNNLPASPAKPVRSFVIKNRPVKEVQGVLEQLMSSGVLGAAHAPSSESPAGEPRPPQGTSPWPPPSQPPTGASATPSPAASGALAARQTPGALKAPLSAAPATPLVLSADEVTNTLVAMGESRVLAQVESILRTLDVRQPQVMLEVLIVSLSDAQTLDLGVELSKVVTSGDTLFRLSSLFGLTGRNAAGDPIAGNPAGFTGLVMNPGDFAAVLRALQTLNKGRSLSMPRMLVANNQQATLESVQDQPYANTNASNTVTTTSFGGSSPAGTQVSLKPQIAGGAGGDHLSLDYSVSLSAFTAPPASPNLPPPKQQNKVQSSASLPDGYTVVVGGIELETNGEGVSQVPGVGNIPILGELFKSRSRTSNHTRFFVFIRANILRSQGFEDLKYLSEHASAEAAIGDGFPVVEPRIIR